MKSPETHGEEPLSTFTLIVIGLEMLAVAAIVCYACIEAPNVGHHATWLGVHTVARVGRAGSEPGGGQKR
jgi:hypothetical protein